MAKVNKTIDKDLGHGKVVGESKRLKGSFVEIGVHEAQGGETYEDSQATIAEVAFWNEFGTINSPERSFLRSTIDENRPELEGLTAKLLGEVMAGKIDTKKALDKLGFKIQQLVKKKILDFTDPANSAATIERKGFNNPLVDSRRLWRSIAFETMVKGGKKSA